MLKSFEARYEYLKFFSISRLMFGPAFFFDPVECLLSLVDQIIYLRINFSIIWSI
jgi:hypothetical protein